MFFKLYVPLLLSVLGLLLLVTAVVLGLAGHLLYALWSFALGYALLAWGGYLLRWSALIGEAQRMYRKGDRAGSRKSSLKSASSWKRSTGAATFAGRPSCSPWAA